MFDKKIKHFNGKDKNIHNMCKTCEYFDKIKDRDGEEYCICMYTYDGCFMRDFGYKNINKKNF